jgi:hypothetical protein
MKGITSFSCSSSSSFGHTKASPYKNEESKESKLESISNELRPNFHTPIGSLVVKVGEKRQKTISPKQLQR